MPLSPDRSPDRTPDPSPKSPPPARGSAFGLAHSTLNGDKVFKGLVSAAAASIPLLSAAMLLLLGVASMDAFRRQGFWHFVTLQDWNPVFESYGAAAFIYGTLVSSLIAMLVAAPAGVAIALAITEFAPLKAREWAAWIVETLAAIPSVVFGLWGMFVMAPFMREYVEPVLVHVPGPFFKGPGTGLSLLTAGLVVAVMVLPTVMAICREVFNAVPVSMRESALALGSTRWEAVRLAVLAPSLPGIVGAVILGMGRALGETMAVTMVIGNRAEISSNLLAPSDSLASVIANQFAEASSDSHLSALAALGFILFAITMLLNMAARLLVWAVSRRFNRSA
jgi:phosphate transport system permease protein